MCREIVKRGVVVIVTLLLLMTNSVVYSQNISKKDTLAIAREMAYSGNFGEAASLLREYNRFKSSSESLELLAWIEHWRGREQSAIKLLNKIPDSRRAGTSTKSLLDEIKTFRIPAIEAGYEIKSDDQPLKLSSYQINGKFYHSWLLSPALNFRYINYNSSYGDRNNGVLWYELSNKINFNSVKLIFDIKAGVLQYKYGNSNEFTWSARVSKQLAKKFTLDFSAGRSPYLYTLKSLYSTSGPVMNNHFSGALIFNSNDNLKGELSYISNNFGEDKRVYTAYFWILAPVLKSKILKLNAGYSFNYSNSSECTFKPESDINGVYTPAVNGEFRGMYDPYFSPMNQYINSIITSASLSAGKSFTFNLKFSYGIAAWSDNPTLWEEQINSAYWYKTIFSKLSFSPLEFEAGAQLKISSRATLNASYTFSKMAFYKLDRGNLTLRINL